MVVVPVIGSVCLVVALAMGYYQFMDIRGKEVTVGQVVALEPHPGSEGGTTYTLVAEFYDAQGRTCTYRSQSSSSAPGYQIGDPFRVYFARENPANCGGMSFAYSFFGFAWILFLIGLLLVGGYFGWTCGERMLASMFPVTVHGTF